ncbi:hypothetical protein BLNAU_3791 [Blattamonas nauphoetae]|uniref:Uncharacterized protein n=1 Tax=Blattamonas nauphoetae TaxID=2049346 RepID=A0ABQ9YC55_9EUKA|nr:hypothetical protein BLNAU_3791 [Blattamonas nauphoetae]
MEEWVFVKGSSFLTTDDNDMLACNGTATTAVPIFSLFPFSLTFYLSVDKKSSARSMPPRCSSVTTESISLLPLPAQRVSFWWMKFPAISDINNRVSFLSAHSVAALSINESFFAEITSTLLKSNGHHICRQLVAHCSDLPQERINRMKKASANPKHQTRPPAKNHQKTNF